MNPTFFAADHFSDSCHYTKKQKNLCVGSFISHNTFQIGSNGYMDTGLRELEVAFFKANST